MLPVGYLGYRSGLLPKVLSILVLIAGGAWIIGTLLGLRVPRPAGVVTAMLAAKAIVEFWLDA